MLKFALFSPPDEGPPLFKDHICVNHRVVSQEGDYCTFVVEINKRCCVVFKNSKCYTVYLFIHSFIHSFIRSFIHSFIHTGSIPSIMTRAQPSTGSRKQSTASGSRSDVVTQQNQGGCGHYRVGHSNNQEKRGHHHEGSGHHHQDGCGHHQEGHGHHHKKGCGHQHQEGHAHRHQEGRGHHQEVRGHNQAGRSHQMGRDHHQMGRGHHQIGHGKCHQEGRAHNQDGRGSVDSKARDIVVICPVRHEVDEVCERCMTRYVGTQIHVRIPRRLWQCCFGL